MTVIAECEINELLSEIDLVIKDFPDFKIIWGGDFNKDIREKSFSSTDVGKFFACHNMVGCINSVSDDNSNIDYTCFHESQGYTSLIDFFVISDSLVNNVLGCFILDEALNLSDHNPVLISFRAIIIGHTSSIHKSCRDSVVKDVSFTSTVFRWNHADTRYFYDVTLQLFDPISKELDKFNSEANSLYSNDKVSTDMKHAFVEKLYTNIVDSLKLAANSTIPKHKTNFFKYWWDSNADILKKESLDSHRLWVNAGRPRVGNLYESRTKCKLRYKTYLRTCAKNEKQQVSDNLHDTLINKDSSSFWKIWKKKIGKVKSTKVCVDGSYDDSIVIEKFTDYLAKNQFNKT